MLHRIYRKIKYYFWKIVLIHIIGLIEDRKSYAFAFVYEEDHRLWKLLEVGKSCCTSLKTFRETSSWL